MPIQAPQWTDYLNCPVCCREFGPPPRSPISLGCGHTLCSQCLKHLHRKQCPFDQTAIQLDLEELVVNTAILQLAGYQPPAQPYLPPCIQALPEEDRVAYNVIVKCMESLAAYLKFCGTASNNVAGNRLSRPMQRKLLTVLQCAVTDEEGRGRAARAARSLGERTVTELILQHQNSQQLSANLWAAVRARGCQFLGPAMQEEVLKLVLLVLEDGSPLSRKVLVMFVVQRLEPHFPQASKTSIGHVVQLLYRASCFKVSKRERDSSLMQLKEEFRSYELLRREHDAQIVQIATESGLRIAPDQWSSLLYGDTTHKSHMQSIIDKLQTPASFTQSVQELLIAMERGGEAVDLLSLREHLDRLARIDPGPDALSPTVVQLSEIYTSLRVVMSKFFELLEKHSPPKDSEPYKRLSPMDDNGATAGGRSPPMPVPPYVMGPREALCAYCPGACNVNHDEHVDRYRNPVGNGNAVHMNGNGAVMHGVPLQPRMVPLPMPPMIIYPHYPGNQPMPNNFMPMMSPVLPSQQLPPQQLPPQQLPLQQLPTQQLPLQQLPPQQLPPQQLIPIQLPSMQLAPMQLRPQKMPAMQLARDNIPAQHFNGPPPYSVMHTYPPNVVGGTNEYYQHVRPQLESNIYPGCDYTPSIPPPAIIPGYERRVGEGREAQYLQQYQPAPEADWPADGDAAWPKINTNVFGFDDLANSLPQLPPATDDVFPYGARSRSVDALPPYGDPFNFRDDNELEKELQALEQRIDKEFKNSD